jgi:Icc-related predicted phosphoesterase
MSATRVFFATDIHGSEMVFFKFLNVRLVHKIDVMILGGDITGKLVIPLVRGADGSYKTEFLGGQWTAKTDEELKQLEKTIRFNGFYPYRTDAEEARELQADRERLNELFSRLMVETLEKWLSVAEERLSKTGIRCYISPGNDDRFVIDKVLDGSDYVINPEERVVDIGGSNEMISLGFTNSTPWHTPRECSEEELASRISGLVSQVNDMDSCIFNLHAPPYKSGLDTAPKLDATLKPVVVGSQLQMIPVGSTAVREALETHQPLLGLHGHVHECKGVCKVGRTLCLNPGSDYQEGVLRGSLIIIKGNKVIDYLHITG